MNIIKRKYLIGWLKVFLVLFFIIPIFLVISFYIFEKKFENRIYPGIYAGTVNLGGKTTVEAVEILNKKLDIINQDGIIFYYDYYQATLFPLISSASGDMAYKLIDIDAEAIVNDAFDLGRNKKFIENLKFKINSKINNHHAKIIGNINNDEINNFLFENFSRFETPPVDAKLKYIAKSSEETEKFIVLDEKYGQVLDYESAIKKLIRNINAFSNSPIELTASVKSPDIFKKDCSNIDAKAKKIFNLAPVTLTHDDIKIQILKNDFVDWLAIKSKKNNPESVYIGINSDITTLYLMNNAIEKIDVEHMEARLQMLENKVSQLQVSKNGM